MGKPGIWMIAKNVPEKAIYAWDPGGQLGVHRMDEFWFEEGKSE